ncbi:unnamed protein product, partial [Musa textilis]
STSIFEDTNDHSSRKSHQKPIIHKTCVVYNSYTTSLHDSSNSKPTQLNNIHIIKS